MIINKIKRIVQSGRCVFLLTKKDNTQDNTYDKSIDFWKLI